MACPKCGGGNVRVAESGFFVDEYHCECGHSYEGFSRAVKVVAVGALATAVLGPAGALAAIAVAGGDDGGGGV